MRIRANLIWLLFAASLSIVASTTTALAAPRLAIRPLPQRTPDPLVPIDDLICVDTIRRASATLADATHRSLGGCLLPAVSCLHDTRLEACCEDSARGCLRHLSSLDESIDAFVRRLNEEDGCSDLPFSHVLSEDGLGFGATIDACARLEPSAQVNDLRSLSRCMARLIVEDVVHRAVSVEHPRALEAILCMGIEDEIPGALRDDPATCEGGSPPATPGPTSTPTPALTPAPSATPAGPTPTPGGPTATPRPTNAPTATPAATAPPSPTPTPTPGSGEECETVTVTIDVEFDEDDFPDVSGISANLDYPEAKVNLPGFGGESSVLGRVTNRTGVSGGLFNVGDQDDAINIGLVSISSSIPSGPFAEVEFDCEPGASAPSPSEFDCAADGSTLLGGAVDASCSIQVDVN